MNLDIDLLKKYQILLIKNPFDEYEKNPHLREILTKVFGLKIHGYKSVYKSSNSLPVGQIDFFSNHLVLCKKEYHELIPVTAFKSISYESCQKYGIDFPIFDHVLNGEEAKLHRKVTRDYINKLISEKKRFAYNSGWTMCPNFGDSKEVRKLMKEFIGSIMYFYYNSENIPNIVASSSAKHKVDQLKVAHGWTYLKDGDKKLPPYPLDILNNEPFYVMHLENNNFLEEHMESYYKFKSLWDLRIIYGEDSKKVSKENNTPTSFPQAA